VCVLGVGVREDGAPVCRAFQSDIKAIGEGKDENGERGVGGKWGRGAYKSYDSDRGAKGLDCRCEHGRGPLAHSIGILSGESTYIKTSGSAVTDVRMYEYFC